MSQDGSWVEEDAPAPPLLAALIRKYGEPCGPDGRSWRLAITEAELTEVSAGRLTVNQDPNSGAVLLRFHPA